MNSLEILYNRQGLNKALSIRSVAAHSLNAEYKLLPSGLRLRTPSATTNTHKLSFASVKEEIAYRLHVHVIGLLVSKHMHFRGHCALYCIAPYTLYVTLCTLWSNVNSILLLVSAMDVQ